LSFCRRRHALTPEDWEQIRNGAGMMQSTPSFNVTIIGNADTIGGSIS
jgi:hypothetical protein